MVDIYIWLYSRQSLNRCVCSLCFTVSFMYNLLGAKNVRYNPFVRSPAGIHTLPETNIGPENRPSRKETASSNHWFSFGYVSFREGTLAKIKRTLQTSTPKLDDLSPHQTTYHIVHTPFNWRQLNWVKQRLLSHARTTQVSSSLKVTTAAVLQLQIW